MAALHGGMVLLRSLGSCLSASQTGSPSQYREWLSIRRVTATSLRHPTVRERTASPLRPFHQEGLILQRRYLDDPKTLLTHDNPPAVVRQHVSGPDGAPCR